MFMNLKTWMKQEKILIISIFFALITMFFIRPDKNYFYYINIRVLCLLFCLMVVIAGFQHCNAFQWLSARILKYCKNGKSLSITLIMIPFLSSMLITNDVALLTFIPFTILLLEQIHNQKAIVPVLVLQTIAANLGSMATPVGNPQNLFLYTTYDLSVQDFFKTMLPLTLFSLVCLIFTSLPLLPKSLPNLKVEGKITSSKHLVFYAILFLLCLLSVFNILPYQLLILLVFISILIVNRKILNNIDYALLATFICFFIISGNLGRIESVQLFLKTLLDKNALLATIGASQIISNVPAAILLSTFTDSWKPLLLGVNIGSLGTPIASLASLITIKLYLATPNANGFHFLKIFLIENIIGLFLLLLIINI